MQKPITPETLAACSTLLGLPPDRLAAAVEAARQPPGKAKTFVHPAEAARRLDVCRMTICRGLRSGTIPGRKIGSQWRVDMAALEG